MGGHGDHGHGHGPPYVIPDYRIYKVSDVPRLVEIEKALAARGLKDPWLRNEVWRYSKEFGTERNRVMRTFFRGFKYGFAAFVVTMVGTEIYNRQFPDEHSHGHGDHH
ncbi:NADH dehydrogenase [ubiquinone] 1 beta subcomplex subunit 3 [Euwallacea similis]|uniref:NADH dehydrogenase [ubiquinone] 1 beta subcomplex subunit 3 n=1 Tax=Euwallacea similis TaxID=1736056 RepID=UPI00345082C4